MGAGFVSYSVDNDRRFRNAVDRAIPLVSDLTIPFKQISRDFYRSEKAIFQLKGPGQYPDFGGFNPTKVVNKEGLTRRELAIRRKEQKFGFAYPLLKASGALAASVLSPDADGSINTITKTSLTLGTSIKYGIYHQSDDPRRKIPLRKFLFIGPEAAQFATSDQMGRAERWLNYINDFVLAKMGLVGTVRGQKVKP